MRGGVGGKGKGEEGGVGGKGLRGEVYRNPAPVPHSYGFAKY